MSGITLKVNREILLSVETSFGQAVDGWVRVQADAPLGTAAR
jgi:hypothetical protein